MGCIAPNPFYTEEIAKRCLDEIFVPTIDAMNKEGRTFKGCLYFGLMITEDGPKVIEYNCRFGDPETQVVLPLLESDLLEIMIAVREGRLSEDIVKFSKKSACCVVMASGGYPNEYEKGYEIKIGEISDNSIVYIAGAKRKYDKLITNGGRVLGLTAIDDTLEGAVSDAYDNIEKISFKKAYYRKDIGSKALIEAL